MAAEHPGGCVGAQHPAQLRVSPNAACAPSRWEHGSWWYKSLCLPLCCPGDTALPRGETGYGVLLQHPRMAPGTEYIRPLEY